MDEVIGKKVNGCVFYRLELQAVIQPFQGCPYNDGLHPGAQGGFATEIFQVTKDLDECVLQDIIGILTVVHDTVSRAVHGVAVPLVQHLLGIPVVPDTPLDKLAFGELSRAAQDRDRVLQSISLLLI